MRNRTGMSGLKLGPPKDNPPKDEPPKFSKCVGNRVAPLSLFRTDGGHAPAHAESATLVFSFTGRRCRHPNVRTPVAVARVFRRGIYRMIQRKTLASEEASYSKDATAKKSSDISQDISKVCPGPKPISDLAESGLRPCAGFWYTRELLHAPFAAHRPGYRLP
jgi:hypothetical protein